VLVLVLVLLLVLVILLVILLVIFLVIFLVLVVLLVLVLLFLRKKSELLDKKSEQKQKGKRGKRSIRIHSTGFNLYIKY